MPESLIYTSILSVADALIAALTSVTRVRFQPLAIVKLGEFFFCELYQTLVRETTKNLSTIPRGSFDDCTPLTDLPIPFSVREIQNRACVGCIRLTSMNLPRNVNRIGECVFLGCYSLATITIQASEVQIGTNIPKGCVSSLSRINIQPWI